MTTHLAWKNLVHDRVRLAVTLTGIAFSLVLMLVQFGLFLGFLETSGNIVERSGADLWITAPGIPHVNAGAPIPERRRFQALAVPGVERADKFILQFNPWKLPSGAWENVQVAGFDPVGGMGGPWQIASGGREELRASDTVMVDDLYRQKLGIPARPADAQFELNGRRARIAGTTRGIRSFTTSPYIFTSLRNAYGYTRVRADETTFLLIRVAPGVDPATVQGRLRAAVSGVDVLTNAEMLAKTRFYWIFKTGAGVTTLIGVVLGFIVGMAVVAQTIYAATVDHLREFGTLKAMGAPNSCIYRVIVTQAALSAVAGYALAITVGWLVAHRSENATALILLPGEVAAGSLALAVAMCVAASMISIRKATRLDPAMVFRG